MGGRNILVFQYEVKYGCFREHVKQTAHAVKQVGYRAVIPDLQFPDHLRVGAGEGKLYGIDVHKEETPLVNSIYPE